MAQPRSFDPYHRWLGIPSDEQPPNHYRLLGVQLFEAEAPVIRDAAERQRRASGACPISWRGLLSNPAAASTGITDTDAPPPTDPLASLDSVCGGLLRGRVLLIVLCIAVSKLIHLDSGSAVVVRPPQTPVDSPTPAHPGSPAPALPAMLGFGIQPQPEQSAGRTRR